jgi:hypothetical protein
LVALRLKNPYRNSSRPDVREHTLVDEITNDFIHRSPAVLEKRSIDIGIGSEHIIPIDGDFLLDDFLSCVGEFFGEVDAVVSFVGTIDQLGDR